MSRFPYEVGVVIPVYNSEHSVGAVVESLLAYSARTALPLRIILVDDCSSDASAGVINHLARSHGCITAAHLACNCGQQSALLCGLSLATDCHYLITMDDDLQHPAEAAELLYQKIREGYDLVYAIPRAEPGKPLYRRAGSLLRDLLFTLFTRKPRGLRVSSYRIMTAELAAKICAERQPFVYLSASAFRYAPRAANIPYCQRERAYGRSGYTLRKLAVVYWNLFRYYTPPGALLRPRHPREPFALQSITRKEAAV